MILQRRANLFIAALIGMAIATPPVAADSYTITDLGSVNLVSGINDSGEVVGWSEVAPSGDLHAFIWRNGTMTDLGIAGTSGAYGINASGQVVGFLGALDNPGALLWQNGKATSLGPGVAFGVNASGQVVGASVLYGPMGQDHAYLWQNGTRTDLGLGFAKGINASGQIVGSNLQDAVVW